MTEAYLDRDFFAANGDCEEHDRYHCERCVEEYMEEKSIKVTEIGEKVASTAISVYDPKVQGGLEVFSKQLSFIKKVKKWNDAKMKRIPVIDIPQLFKECQAECTVGDLESFIDDQETHTGLWATLFGKKDRKKF